MYAKKQLTYINKRGESIQIGYFHPFYLIHFDGGIGIPKIKVYTSKGNGQDGATYTGSTIEMRNPVITFQITRDYINKRNELYKIFIPKSKGTLVFEQGTIKRKIECYIESLDIDDRKKEKIAEVSLLCPSPYFEAFEEIKNDIAQWLPQYEFPFELISDGIEMGYRELSLVTNVINEGNITLGMVIKMKATGTVTNPSLYDVYKNHELKINTEMQAGDIITIDTRYGKKRIELERGGITSNIINFIDYNSVFLQLEPGDNLIRYGADININNLDVSLYYTPAYLGV